MVLPQSDPESRAAAVEEPARSLLPATKTSRGVRQGHLSGLHKLKQVLPEQMLYFKVLKMHKELYLMLLSSSLSIGRSAFVKDKSNDLIAGL